MMKQVEIDYYVTPEEYLIAASHGIRGYIAIKNLEIIKSA